MSESNVMRKVRVIDERISTIEDIVAFEDLTTSERLDYQDERRRLWHARTYVIGLQEYRLTDGQRRMVNELVAIDIENERQWA